MQKIARRFAIAPLMVALWSFAAPAAAQSVDDASCGALCITASSSFLADPAAIVRELNNGLSSLLGVDLGLDDVRVDLIGAQVPVDDFVTELEAVTGTTSLDDALNSEATLSEIFTAAANAAANNGDPAAATALQALATNTSGLTDGVLLSDFLVLDTTEGELSGANLSTLDLVSGSVQLYNARYGAGTPEPVVIDILGLGEVRAYLQITEAPQLVCGPESTTFRSAAVRTKIDIALNEAPQPLDLGVAVVEIQSPDVSLYVEVGEADGSVTSIDVANQTAQATMTPGVVNAYLGEIDDAVYFARERVITADDIGTSTIADATVTIPGIAFLPDTVIPASIRASSNGETVSFGSGTLDFTAPYPQTRELDVPINAVDQVVGGITNNLNVELDLPGGPLVDPIESVIEAAVSTAISDIVDDAITQALGQAVDPVLAALGITIGGGEATVLGVSDTCDDFGDCPISGTAPDGTSTNAYGTPSHALSDDLYLGLVPADGDAQHRDSADAQGDDTTGADDEDGVSFPALAKGDDVVLNVTVAEPSTATGYLMAWVDWDGNGVFDAGEVIADDLQDTDGDGTIAVPLTVPAGNPLSTTFARFRYSSQAELASDGLATDGEVEDYAIVFVTPEGSISGTLFEDADLDGNLTDGEPVLPADITVSLFDDRGTPADDTDDVLVATTQTTAEGTYEFLGVSTLSTYRVLVDAADAEIPAGLSVSTGNPLRGLAVVADTELSGQDFGFVPTPPSADLSLTKTALDPATGQPSITANAGASIDFVLTVSNAGPDTATGIEVLDLLPNGYVYLSDTATDQGQSYDTGTGIWQAGQLDAGQSTSITLRVQMQASGEHTNHAEIVASSLPDPDSDPSVGRGVDDLADGLADDDEANATVAYTGTGAVLSGTIFFDNGANATAYDALQGGSELGTSLAFLEVFDAGGTLIDTPEIAADGSWSLVLPDGYAQSVRLALAGPPQVRVVSEQTSGLPALVDADARDGSYTFTPEVGASYASLDFGVIRAATLGTDQQVALRPGQVISLPHSYTADAEGSVVFDLATPTNTAFNATLFVDTGCDGSPDQPVTGPINIQADTTICLIARVSSSAGAANGDSIAITLTATTQYGSSGLIQEDINTDRVRVETQQGTLKLSKTVRNVTDGASETFRNQASIGDTLEYRITLENLGTLPASEITIYDRTPPYTTLAVGSDSPVTLAPGVTCTRTVPADQGVNYQGDLQWVCAGDYLPGARGSVSFRVEVAP